MVFTENAAPVDYKRRSLLENSTRTSTHSSPNSGFALSTGDPKMLEPFWQRMGDKCKVVIRGDEFMSYFSDVNNVCWFLEPELGDAIRRLHGVVGNAVTEERHIVVGTGSSLLFQAVLYALTTPGGAEPVSVVSSAPYYTQYQEVIDCIRSRLYKWEGDANRFKKDGPYIEVVNSPNNPDGSLREAVVKKSGDQGMLIHDLAYYWPHYTAITSAADHDIMLFTLSKCTGHAGSRIGWAIVKNKEIAKKMTEYIRLSSIGVSRESQFRAAKMIGVICDACENVESTESDNLFKHSRHLMAKRWQKLRESLQHNRYLSLFNYPCQHCLFSRESVETLPAYAWLKCDEGIKNCDEFLRGIGIIARGGEQFGANPKFARVSLLCKEDDFNRFIERLYVEGHGAQGGSIISN